MLSAKLMIFNHASNLFGKKTTPRPKNLGQISDIIVTLMSLLLPPPFSFGEETCQYSPDQGGVWRHKTHADLLRPALLRYTVPKDEPE